MFPNIRHGDDEPMSDRHDPIDTAVCAFMWCAAALMLTMAFVFVKMAIAPSSSNAQAVHAEKSP